MLPRVYQIFVVIDYYLLEFVFYSYHVCMQPLRLLVIADRPPRSSVLRTVNEHAVDAIVTLGDLAIQDIRELEQITHIPKYGVYGNHDSGTYMEELGIQNLHLTAAEINGVTLGGFEGSVRYKADAYAPMYTQEEALDMIRRLPPVDLLISHAPPRGIHDEEELSHQGFDALRWYVEQYHPSFLLHGHTYPTSTIDTLGKTVVVYIFEDQLVELNFDARTVYLPEIVH